MLVFYSGFLFQRKNKLKFRKKTLDIRTEEAKQKRVRSVLAMQEQACVPNTNFVRKLRFFTDLWLGCNCFAFLSTKK